MIANKALINGYKRFKNATAHLDRKLIAIVGPNEAGKSSFLNALLSIETSTPYSKTELTKGVKFEEKSIIVKVEYLIEEFEKQKVKEFQGVGNPRYYNYYKVVSGEVYHELIGDVKRDKVKRKQLLKFIKDKFSKTRIQNFLNDNYFHVYVEGEDDIEESYSLFNLLAELKTLLESDKENFSSYDLDSFNKINSILESDLTLVNKTIQKVIDEFSILLNDALELEKLAHPKDRFLKFLSSNRPKFIEFNNDERFFKASYTLEELGSPSQAIKNLLKVGGIELQDVLNSINEEEIGERLKLLETVNKNLKTKYSESWSQAPVYPQVLFDIDSIKIQIRSTESYNEITDRSDGLKQYIALRAFLATRNFNSKPILLIDEAEIHLHYAAQSDLIIEFEKQKDANSILYTTHSAGCLPSDLGTGIRSVEPIINNSENTGLSIIKNSIWSNNGGFSPILFAMGANVIAFTLARKAVIAEGPSETILLPRMFREAMSIHYLDFQVAPGIASISKDNAALFEFESAKTTYLVDGDNGGKSNRKKLEKGGIDPEKIFDLPEKYSLEDFIKPEIILRSIQREFRKSGRPELEIDLSLIPETNRIKWFETKCTKIGNSLPSKVRIAENITREESDLSILDKSRISKFKAIYKSISKKLSS